MNAQSASRYESKKIINARRAKRCRGESPPSAMLSKDNEQILDPLDIESDNSDYFEYSEEFKRKYLSEEFVNNDTQSAESTYAQLIASTSSCPCTSNVLHLIFGEMQKLNKNVQDISQRIDKLEAQNRKIQTHLLTEIISQRKLSTGNKPRLLLPPKPFQTMEDIDKFENDLNNSSELCEQLEAELLNYKIANPSKFVRTILRKIFSDEVATKYSWKGTTAKKCIIDMTITTTLRDAFNQKFSTDEKQFSTICIKWFQTATDRIKYYKKA